MSYRELAMMQKIEGLGNLLPMFLFFEEVIK